jgi:hypothetical protein
MTHIQLSTLTEETLKGNCLLSAILILSQKEQINKIYFMETSLSWK